MNLPSYRPSIHLTPTHFGSAGYYDSFMAFDFLAARVLISFCDSTSAARLRS